MDGTNTTTAWTIAGVIALVIIIAGGWLISRERSGLTSDTASSTDTTLTGRDSTDTTNTGSGPAMTGPKPVATSDTSVPTPTMVAGGETVTVNDQPAGMVVKVENVKIMKPSWVAIMGTNGWVIGAGWLYASADNAEIELVKPTVAGEIYQAVIYVDDGDKKFSLHAGDSLVTSSEGAPVSSTFKAQ